MEKSKVIRACDRLTDTMFLIGGHYSEEDMIAMTATAKLLLDLVETEEKYYTNRVKSV